MNTAAPTRGAPGVREATKTVCAGTRYLLSDREMAAADRRATATRPVPHAELAADPSAVSSDVVAPCPVGHRQFGGGDYRSETTRENRGEPPAVSLDAHPCVGCGACAVVRTDRERPRGGGVEFGQG